MYDFTLKSSLIILTSLLLMYFKNHPLLWQMHESLQVHKLVFEMVLIPAANTFGMEFRKCSKSWSERDLRRPFRRLPSPRAGSAAHMLSLVDVCVIFPEGEAVI